MQGVLTLGAIGWGAYQLASKIRQKVGEGNKLGSKAVVKEIAITTVTSSISFLTGGVADALTQRVSKSAIDLISTTCSVFEPPLAGGAAAGG